MIDLAFLSGKKNPTNCLFSIKYGPREKVTSCLQTKKASLGH